MIEVSISDFLDNYYSKRSRPSRNTIYLWLRNGTLPAVQRGRKWFIQVRSFDDYTPVEKIKPTQHKPALTDLDPIVQKVLSA